MKVKEALHQGYTTLQRAGVQSARLDAEVLLASLLGVGSAALFIMHDDILEPAKHARYDEFIDARAAKKPVAYILGHKEFWSLEFEVSAHTLIPRPESETVIEFVLEQFPKRDKSYQILDLGAGSGCLGLTLLKELPNAHCALVDISADALKVTANNARKLGVSARATLTQSDWCEALPKDSKYDIVVCNPPYIGPEEDLMDDVRLYEPATALFAGDKGFAEYVRLAREVAPFLGGMAFFEVGALQAEKVCEIFKGESFEVVGVKKDLAGVDRVVGVFGIRAK